MHTSQVLRSGDFHYAALADPIQTEIDFETFCPHYQVWNRIGVISPHLEDGILHTGYALLALTTVFYDDLRAQTDSFFDYPHHFAFFDATDAGVATRHQRVVLDTATLGSPWGALDVWPDSNWILAPGTVTGMLKKVFDWQISGLFWPYGFLPEDPADKLPLHVWRLLHTRLHTVYYYDSPQPTHEIRVTQVVEDMVQRGLERMPPAAQPLLVNRAPIDSTSDSANEHIYAERYQRVSPDDFLAEMAICFETA